MPMLDVENIHTYYGHIHALKDVSLSVEKGEIVTLIGSNGAGKTTLLKTISGLLPPRLGSIRFNAEDLTRCLAHEIVARGIVQVPEGRRVFNQLTVMENLEMGAFSCKDPKLIRVNLERVFALFPKMKERSKQVAGTLSGGEQQMLAIGRALMANPRLLLMDEPSMGLAPVLVDGIFETIQRLNAGGTTILLVEQNASIALQVANRGYILQSGSVVLSDTAERLSTNEMIRKVYLGEM